MKKRTKCQRDTITEGGVPMLKHKTEDRCVANVKIMVKLCLKNCLKFERCEEEMQSLADHLEKKNPKE